jgi:fructokinase
MDHKPVVAGIGELLWDVLPTGKQIGGAPTNFTFHAMQAGCESVLISAIGNDLLGDELLNELENLKLNCEYIQRNEFPTGTVTVTLNEKGHPQYVIHQNVAWDNILMKSKIESKLKTLDAVCFGSLGQRSPVSAATIQMLLEGLQPDCLKVFDINLRQQFYSFDIIEKSLQFADVLKVNDDELPVLSDLFDLNGDVENQLLQITNQFNLQYVAYTMGEKGSILMNSNDFSFVESIKVKVADTVGAGDSFTAILISGLLKGIPLAEIHDMASKTAAYVCTQKGATPVIPYKIF